MKYLPKWLKLAGVLMVLALALPILAACGGGNGNATAPATTGAGGNTPAVAATATKGAGAATAATSPTSGGGTPTTSASPSKATGSPTGSPAGSPAGSPVTTGGVRMGPGDPNMGQTIEPAQKTGGTLIEGSISDISTVMPVVTNDDASGDFESLIFEGMIETDPFTLQPVGSLAVGWESNADATIWTVYLRQGVTWQDGTPFTANDVKFTYDLQMNPATGSSYTADLTSKIKSVEVVDDLTVRFTMNNTLVDAPLDVLGYAIVADHIWKNVDPAAVQQDPGATGQDPARVVGTGPFKFQEWVTGDNASAVRYDNYWGGAPKLDKYIYKVVPDQAAGVAQLQTGEIDFFQGVSPSQVADFQGNPDVTITPANRLSFTFYGTNLDPAKTTLFQDKEVRQAMLYAIDRESLVRDIQFNFAQVAVGTMPPLSWAYNPDGIQNKYPYDPQKAKQLLQQAGWTDTNGDGTVDKGGKELAFTMYTNAGNQVREAYLTALQEFWAQIGIKMTPQLEPFPALVDRITVSRDFEAYLLGFGWSAAPDQSAMWATNSYENGFNTVKYSNPAVDQLLAQANAEMDQQKRIQLYTQMQNLVLEDLPQAIIDFPQMPTGVNNRVHNIFPSDINTYWNVETWWVE